ITLVEPDQSRARIESMVSTLAPVMERAPLPPSYYTATLPISTTGGIEGTPTVDYSGPLTWTLPQFASYTGPLTETTGFFFDPGQPGYTFNVSRATTLVDLAVRAGMTAPITFEPELVPPPPIGPDLLLPPLKERLAKFPGVTSILVKDLGTDETIYESNVDYILSGMSVVKIGIMVEVYRHFGGEVDAETHQEMLDMLGSSSCNPCANRLLATVGGGSRYDGAAQVTKTMRRLGLDNFYLCAPFQEVRWDDGNSGYAGLGDLVWAANLGLAQETKKPGYDRCVRATPREMADLMEMIYRGSQDEGLLHDAYPNIFTPQVCQDMIDIMAANDLRNMLGSGIPAEVKLAHKHGFSGYAVPWGDTRAEVGIIFAPGTNWLISFYIWQDTDWINWGINQPLYRDVSNMLYNYFSPEAQYWPLPPWAPTPEPAESSDGGA
ncbi:MAG: serine hydrolase, partial [Anaerolineae bacterium]